MNDLIRSELDHLQSVRRSLGLDISAVAHSATADLLRHAQEMSGGQKLLDIAKSLTATGSPDVTQGMLEAASIDSAASKLFQHQADARHLSAFETSAVDHLTDAGAAATLAASWKQNVQQNHQAGIDSYFGKADAPFLRALSTESETSVASSTAVGLASTGYLDGRQGMPEAAGISSSAAKLLQQHEESWRLSAFGTSSTDQLGNVGSVVSLASSREHYERLNLQAVIDSYIGHADAQSLRALAIAPATSVAAMMAFDSVSASRRWEASSIESYAASLMGGLTREDVLRDRDYLGSVSLTSVAALALEERAGLSQAYLHAHAQSSLQINGDAFSFAAGGTIAQLVGSVRDYDHFCGRIYDNEVSTQMLAHRMTQMGEHWVRMEDEMRSATSFARLQALGDVLGGATPYAPAVGAVLRAAGMGDWRDTITLDDRAATPQGRMEVFTEQGGDIQVVEPQPQILIPSAAMAQLFATGEDWHTTWAVVQDDDEQLATLAFQRMRELERSLRRFIGRALQLHYGPKWQKQALPNNMLEQLIYKQKASEGKADFSEDLLDYLDFSDYVRLIEKGDNWRGVFVHVFKRSEDVKESLQRLYPLRLATMHARSVCPVDLMTLWMESKRIESAIRDWDGTLPRRDQ